MSSDNGNSNSSNPVQNVQDQISQVISQFSKPDFTLRAIIKTSVTKTNILLSTLQTKKYEVDTQVNSFASSRIVPVMNKVKFAFQEVLGLYQQREYYGPQIVAGSALAVGSIVSLRRGRIPGVFTAATTGAGAYGAIYGIPKID